MTALRPPPVLEIVDLVKDFGSFRALDGVSLCLQPGTVHAVLGENGAGKSTLVKCVMGYHRATSGLVLLDGITVTADSPRRAQALGIGMVYQHFTLVPNLTVAENLVLARADLAFVIDWRKEARALAAFMARMPFQVPLDAPVRSLAAGDKQKLEILKQLYLESRIVILDEPTSVLTPNEADEVLGRVRQMAKAEEISVLIITHKFREVVSFADEITVLRRGRVTGRGKVCDTTPAQMAEMMVGASPEAPPSPSHAVVIGAPRLRVDELSADDDLGAPALHGISFEVCPGEILGVAAVAGNGQEALVEVLAGQRPRTGGTVRLHDQPFQPTRAAIRRHRMRCLPEEPLANACVASMTVAENLAFRDFDQPPYAVAKLMSRPQIARRARAVIAEYGVRTRSPETPIGELSGGNVQRVVLARELGATAEVLVVANPCMGLDFRAVGEIHRRLRTARGQGAAIVLVSADLDEIFALADRIIVLSGGKVVHETTAAAADMRLIGERMAGHG
jgi:simple sugar transport system ATP-binding protein